MSSTLRLLPDDTQPTAPNAPPTSASNRFTQFELPVSAAGRIQRSTTSPDFLQDPPGPTLPKHIRPPKRRAPPQRSESHRLHSKRTIVKSPMKLLLHPGCCTTLRDLVDLQRRRSEISGRYFLILHGQSLNAILNNTTARIPRE